MEERRELSVERKEGKNKIRKGRMGVWIERKEGRNNRRREGIM